MDIQKHVEGHAVKIFNKNNRVGVMKKTSG